MIRGIDIKAAQDLLAKGEVDLVDVRDANEWERGHLPGARLVPLGELKADAKAHLGRDKILFVCGGGGRSMTAAKLAEALGFKEVYSLDGGTRGWIASGLPIEMPEAAAAAPSAQRAEPAQMEACEVPDPGLDAIVGENMRDLRAKRGMSLDALAAATNLSRALLGQVELGRTSAGVNALWRIARAFDVHFSALLAAPGNVTTWLSRGKDAKRMVSADGRYSSRALFPLGQQQPIEFYELWLAGHAREDAEAHQPGTRETLVVASGRLELVLKGERFELGKGDAIVFGADVPHSYVNPANEECWMHLVITYA